MHRYSFPHSPVAHPEAIISAGKYRFSVLANGLLRYEWAEDHQFEDRASILAINRRLPIPEFRVQEDQHSLQILTSRFHLTYDKQEFSPNGLSAVIKGNYGPHVSVWRYGVQAPNLGGTTRTLDEADGRVDLGQGVISRQGFATLDDSTSMLFDDRQWVTTRLPGNRVDGYLFAYGHDYRQAIQAFYLLSGPQPLLPRWALGNWWSRYYPYTADEYLKLMDRFRQREIPLSVAVLDMDWHIVQDQRVKEAGVTGWTGYTWNKELFPEPKAFLKELHDRGLRISLNDHPADGVQSYEDPYEEMAIALNHDVSMGDPIPFDITNQAFLDAFFDVLHRRFEKEGLDLWWVDWQQGTHSRIPGIDPLWVLNHYHFLDSALDNKRPLTFSRYAGPGSHRYPIGFSGDTVVSWDSLHFQPEFTATASNIGFGWWSHDIGGHFHGEKNDEMLIRWIQYGAFSPILRLHSSNNVFSIKEPWNLEPQYEQIMTEYLQFRHRLLPYLYSMNVRAAVQGLPLVQPMYWGYPEIEESYKVPNQYIFGTDLIVVPITTPQDPRSRRAQVLAWLPPGRHVDIFTGLVYDGYRRIWLNRRLKEYPVFAPEGAIIPLDAASVLANGCTDSHTIELLVVVGADGSFELLEDDGKGQYTDKINFRRTQISFNQQAGELHIGPTTGGNVPQVRHWTVRFLGCASSETIQVSFGRERRMINGKNFNNGLCVDLGSHPQSAHIVVKLEDNPALMMNQPGPQIIEFLRGAQISLDLKDDIRKIVESSKSRLLQIGDLHALGLDSVLLNPILEFLFADSRLELTNGDQDIVII
ncbi:Alpha-xylosidase [Penicillium rolfsii]|nr:Alpha-xylosidase [Penicillium rolfsii]